MSAVVFKNLFRVGVCSVGLLFLLGEPALAHGGQYRGPGDVVPPNPGGGHGPGPGTGGHGPAVPGSPSGGNPGTPTASPNPANPNPGPAPGRPTVTGRRGIDIGEDITTWDYWWEFNKDPFLRLRDAIHSDLPVSGSDVIFTGHNRKVDARDNRRPTDDQKQNVVLPALKKAIDSTEQPDINSSCMVAMAKVGKDHPEFKLREVFAARLSRPDQEVRETAALALGIAALPDTGSIELLLALAGDSAGGRKASNQSEVNDRTRTFATYGLGLIAHANASVALKRQVFEALRGLLADDGQSSRNLKVAVVNAISLLHIGTGEDAGKTLAADAVECLLGYYRQDRGVAEQLLQAHVPTAVAKLLGKDFHDRKLVESCVQLFRDDLGEKARTRRSSGDIQRSCALALGQLCPPFEVDGDVGAATVGQLLELWHTHKDAQVRSFAILAIGQIGGARVRNVLLQEFSRAQETLEKPWVALAMGVRAFADGEARRAAGLDPVSEDEFGRALARALGEVGDPLAQGGIAVALGLCRYRHAADTLRAMLMQNSSKDQLAGYLCIALALMDDRRSIDDIRDLTRRSVRRPTLLQQAAIALGKLGDKEVAEQLQSMLVEDDRNLAKMSAIASALGFIGDRRSIEPLKTMLFDETMPNLSRAFAAVALGGVADKEDLPWNSKIAQNLNYRAAVETLTDKQAGILDIL